MIDTLQEGRAREALLLCTTWHSNRPGPGSGFSVPCLCKASKTDEHDSRYLHNPFHFSFFINRKETLTLSTQLS